MTKITNPEYTDVVQKIGQMLFQALWEGEANLDKKVRELDNIVNQLLRRIGLLVESLLLTKLASVVTKKALVSRFNYTSLQANKILIVIWHN